jgi:hypothetical protein
VRRVQAYDENFCSVVFTTIREAKRWREQAFARQTDGADELGLEP